MNPYTLYPLTAPRGTVLGSDVSTLAYKLVDSIASAATVLDQRFTHWNKRRKAIAELSGLSNYILRDIGVNRGEISAVVDGLLDVPVVDRFNRPRLVAQSSWPERCHTTANDDVAGLAA
jgi:uncharacterized protein YjiS (DUF1127 family)